MSQSDKSKESSMAELKEHPVAVNSTRKSGGSQHPPKSFGSKILRFSLVCLYILFLAAVVLGALAGIEYYAYLKIKSGPIGEAYKGRDLDAARQSSQKVAPQYGYEPTPGLLQ
jgi:hypothetical protein